MITFSLLTLVGFAQAQNIEPDLINMVLEQDSSQQNECCESVKFNIPVLHKEGFVNNNGIKIHYTITGKKHAPTIVLIHAFPLDSKMFRCQVEGLSNSYRIVTLDLRGYGQSQSAPNNDYSVDAFVSDVRAVINKLKIKNPILGGSSIGSVVAQVYVASFQDVSKLLLFSPYVQVSGLPLGLDPAIFTDIVAGLLTDREATLAAIIAVQTPETCKQIKKIRTFLARMASRASTAALVGTIEQAFPFTTAPFLPLIQIPTLIMFGKQDSLENRLGIYFLRDNIVNSRLVEFPGGHVFNLTQSKIVNKILLAFLRENPSKCPTCFSGD